MIHPGGRQPSPVTRRQVLATAASLPLAGLRLFGSEQSPATAAEGAVVDRLREIESQLRGARLGVAALNLSTGRAVRYQADEPYPMWSTYKIPIALSVLKQVQAGTEQLDRVVTIEPRFFSSGSGILTEYFSRGTVALSVRNLLELMIVLSDNTATAILLESVGGGRAVTADLRAWGVSGIRVDMPNMQRAARLLKGYALPPKEAWNAELARHVDRSVGSIRPGTPDWAFAMQVLQDDPRDQGSPDGFVALLRALSQHRLLGPAAESVALDIMRRCRGDALRALLPRGVVVAHKPGGGPGSNNDVGLLEVPGGPVLAVAVLMRNATLSGAVNEQAIAMASRAVFDALTEGPA
jgi:beta-lactamase class A